MAFFALFALFLAHLSLAAIPGKDYPAPSTPEVVNIRFVSPASEQIVHHLPDPLVIHIEVEGVNLGVHGVEFGMHGVAFYYDGEYISTLYHPPLALEIKPHFLGGEGKHQILVALVNQRHELTLHQKSMQVTIGCHEDLPAVFCTEKLPRIKLIHPQAYLPLSEENVLVKFDVENRAQDYPINYDAIIRCDDLMWRAAGSVEPEKGPIEVTFPSLSVPNSAPRRMCRLDVDLSVDGLEIFIDRETISVEILHKELVESPTPLYMSAHAFHNLNVDPLSSSVKERPCWSTRTECSKKKKYVYLMQAPSDISNVSFFEGDESDAIILTYKTLAKHMPNSIFYPHSTWNQGRNALLRAALQQQCEYEYFIFLDDDVTISLRNSSQQQQQDESSSSSSFSSSHPLRVFERFLADYRPAVGVGNWPLHAQSDWHEWSLVSPPSDEDSSSSSSSDPPPNTLYWFDHFFVAYHRNAAPFLLPYFERFDSISTYYSQNIIIHLSAMFFEGRVLQSNAIKQDNAAHRWLYEGKAMVNEHLMYKPEDFLKRSIVSKSVMFGFRSHLGYTHFNGRVVRGNGDEISDIVSEAESAIDKDHPLWQDNQKFWTETVRKQLPMCFPEKNGKEEL